MEEPGQITFGIRDERFKSFIISLLVKCRIKEKYINFLVNDTESMDLYAKAFTNPTADPKNNYDVEIKKTDRTKLPMADKRANYFMRIGTDGDTPSGILNSIENMKRVLYPQFKDNIMLVDYGILMQDTKWTIDAIYDFLEIEHYESDLDNLSTPHTYNDTWGVKNHHTVKSSIKQEKYDLEKIFLPETIEKYSGLEFWRE
jgi:hypothetical protein